RRHTRSKRDWSSDVCSSDLKQLGIPAVVVTPYTSSEFKRKKITEHGAEMVFCEVEERFEVTDKLAEERGLTIVPPFDDELIMARSQEHTSELQSRYDLVCCL